MALDVDIIDIVTIDDKTSAYTDKQIAFSTQLFMNHSLNLPQLEGKQTRLVVGLHKVAVVAVRRDKDYLFWCDAHQISGGGYDQILLEHDAAKVITLREIKDYILIKMYETS